MLDLPFMAGIRHLPLPHQEWGHQPWEHPSAGTPWPQRAKIPPCVVVRKGLCPALQAPPKHPSHLGAPRPHPTFMLSLWTTATPGSSPGQGTLPDLHLPFLPTPLQPWTTSVGPVGCSMEDPQKLCHTQRTETHPSYSFTLFQLRNPQGPHSCWQVTAWCQAMLQP